jgi:hypothetical protein
VAREQRDHDVERIRTKYGAKLSRLDDRVRRAQQAVDREAAQASQQKLQTAVSMGATVLGALFGRKAISASTLGKATTAARGMGRTMKESQDIERAKESLAAAQREKAELEAGLQAEIDTIVGSLEPLSEPLETVTLRPKRTEMSSETLVLAWTPFWQDAGGGLTPAYR